MRGETESGDQYLVQPLPTGALVAVLDGLGHGAAAAAAAKTAVAVLQDHAQESLIPLLNRCHNALRKTHGVALSMASFQAADRTLAWLGVGNVECLVHRRDLLARPARVYLLPRGGVVGYQFPAPRVSVLAVAAGDVLLLATDGVRGGFTEGLNLDDPPRQIAEDTLARFAKDTDDALVLVARFGEMNLAMETPHGH
ncbi:MAG: SpoIIE family protein phosphatase [Isosphaeraceae bacterium]